MRRVAEISEHARDRAEEVQKKATRRYQKLERKLERASKKLPVDTPLDKRRRRRNVKRAETGGGLGALAALVAGGAAYLVWRARRTVQPDAPAPGSGATRHGANGEGSPKLSTPAKS